MNKLSVSLLNETWLYKSDKQVRKQLQEMKYEFNLDIIRKDRNSRGGDDVAIVYDTRLVQLKKLQLKSLMNCRFEILAARGKLKAYKKRSDYFLMLPPT